MGMKEEAAKSAVQLDAEAFIADLKARAAEEHARGSDASESAAKVKEFLEDTNMNSQAYSWAKTILKKLPKKDGAVKAMDVIRSLEAALPLLKNHIMGNSPQEMNLDGDAEPEAAPDEDDGTVTPIDFNADQAAEAG